MEHSYFVRITPYNSISFEDIIEVLHSIDIQKYCISYEEASRPHYHLCLWSPRSVENLRWNLKQAINGQVYISGKEIQDKVKAIAYTIKDGNYRQNGIDIHTFLMANQIKHKKVKFDDELKLITDDLQLSGRSLIGAIIDLHVKCNRKIYRAHIRAIYELAMCKRDKNFRSETIERIFSA